MITTTKSMLVAVMHAGRKLIAYVINTSAISSLDVENLKKTKGRYHNEKNSDFCSTDG